MNPDHRKHETDDEHVDPDRTVISEPADLDRTVVSEPASTHDLPLPAEPVEVEAGGGDAEPPLPPLPADDDGETVDAADAATIVADAAVLPPSGSSDLAVEPATDTPDHQDPPSTVVGVESAPGGKRPLRMSDLLGRTVGDRFTILDRLGKGGMGSVFRGRDESLDRDVAIKVISRKLAQSPTFVDRFQREAKMMAKIDHKHVVRVIEHGVAYGLNYIVMDLVNGPKGKPTTVSDLMREYGKKPMPLADALRVFSQACDAIHEANERDIIHRDIKPGNMLVDARGDIRIADFGIASDQATDVRHTSATSEMGTGAYMPPEQARNPRSVDRRADVFALGTVLYELLTGRLPEGTYRQPSSLRRDVPKALDAVIAKAREANPKDRYPTAAALASAARTAAAATLAQRAKVWGFYAAVAAIAVAAAAFMMRPSLEEQWWQAVERRDQTAMASLWGRDPGLLDYTNAEDGHRTALIVATINEDESLVRWLLDEAGADPNVQPVDDAGAKTRTALMHASERGAGQIVAYLLRAGARPELTIAPDRTARDLAATPSIAAIIDSKPLYEAARANDITSMRAILTETPSLASFRFGDSGLTMLHIAAWEGLDQAVGLLLERLDRSAIDAETSDAIDSLPFLTEEIELERGATPLLAAVIRSNERVVRLLLDAGADPSLAGYENDRPLIYAVKSKAWNIARLLVEGGAPRTIEESTTGKPLLVLALEADVDEATFRWLASDGGTPPKILPSLRDAVHPSTGETPLVAAIRLDRCDLAQFLLDQSAEPSDAAVAAARASDARCMATLAADLEEAQREEAVAVAYAPIVEGNLAELDRVLSLDPTLVRRTYRGSHLLDIAIDQTPAQQKAATVDRLLESGAELSTTGDPTLHRAVRSSPEVWRSIVDHALALEASTVAERIADRNADGRTLIFEAIDAAPGRVADVLQLVARADRADYLAIDDASGRSVLDAVIDTTTGAADAAAVDRGYGALRAILDALPEDTRVELLNGTRTSAPPLHRAAKAMGDDRRVCQVLIDYGADLLLEDAAGRLAAEVASDGQRTPLAERTAERVVRLETEAIAGARTVLERLRDGSPDLFESDWGRDLALESAISDRWPMAALLLEQGAPVGNELLRTGASAGSDALSTIQDAAGDTIEPARFAQPLDEDGNTLLHLVAADPAATEVVLDWAQALGVEAFNMVSVQNDAGLPPLFVAADASAWASLRPMLEASYEDTADIVRDPYDVPDRTGRSLRTACIDAGLEIALKEWRRDNRPPVDPDRWYPSVKGWAFVGAPADRSKSYTVRIQFVHGEEAARVEYSEGGRRRKTTIVRSGDARSGAMLRIASVGDLGAVEGEIIAFERGDDDTCQGWTWKTDAPELGTIIFTRKE